MQHPLSEIAAFDDVIKEMTGRAGQPQQALNPADILSNYKLASDSIYIDDIIEETPSTKTIRIKSRLGKLPPFQAGQYVNIHVKASGVNTHRAYAIASSPHTLEYYDITVKRTPNPFVSAHLLDELKVGDPLWVTGPTGNFYYNPLFHGQNLVFLAGGSGITPAMSMIRDITEGGRDLSITVIYGSKTEDDIIFKKTLDQISSVDSRVTIHHIISEPGPSYQGYQGFITADTILNIIGQIDGRYFYVCGPEVMYGFCAGELRKLGVPDSRIKYEVNGPPANPSSIATWPDELTVESTFQVTVDGQAPVAVKAGEPLLNSLERNGISMPSECRSGECSLCRCKLVSGSVVHADSAHIRKSDIENDYIHTCVAFPTSDVTIKFPHT